MIGRTNTGGGGGKIKDTDAVLRVIAPAGSVVTITKGGVSKSDNGHENADNNSLYDYYFVIHQSQFDGVNPWTITATLNTKTASSTIIINAAQEFDLLLVYTYYLVENGAVTNSITKLKTSNTVTQDTGYVRFSDTNNNQIGIFSSTDSIDLTNYSLLKLIVTGSSNFSYGGNNNVPTICIGSNRPTTSGGSADITGIIAYSKLGAGSDVNISAGTYTVDVSAYTGNYYIAICMAGTSNRKFVLDVTTFGLEA